AAGPARMQGSGGPVQSRQVRAGAHAKGGDNRGTFSGTCMMQILSELAAMPAEIAGLVAQVPAEKLAWTPLTWDGIPGGRFTALGQACHLRDIEIDGYHVRFGRTLREDRPDLVSIDSYELARERRYEADDAAAAIAAFRKARRETIAML